MGIPTPQDNSTPPQVQQETAGFSFVVPTEFVELPSGGRFYPETHPLYGQTTIEVKQMTAKEEDMLTSRTLLKNGVAIERVIQSLIMDKRINPDSMLVGDRNAVIIAARISGYGSDYNTNVSCPSCGTTQEYGIDLRDANVYSGQNADALGVVDNGNGTFTTTLPKTRVQVAFRLLNGADEKNLVTQLESARKRKRPEQAITTQIRNMVVSVNGDESIQALNYLIENIPSLDARHLRTCYREVAPNIDLTQVFQCGECGHEQDMEVPLSADFFWPDR
jgi:hypothetical protein